MVLSCGRSLLHSSTKITTKLGHRNDTLYSIMLSKHMQCFCCCDVHSCCAQHDVSTYTIYVVRKREIRGKNSKTRRPSSAIYNNNNYRTHYPCKYINV